MSARDPQQYAAVLREITANGEIISAEKYLVERGLQVQALVNEFRAGADIVQ